MHVAPPAIRTVVVPAGLTVLLGLYNPPRSWTGTVGLSLPDFTIAPCVDVDVSYVAPQAHIIVNVALHREYSPSIVFIFSQGRKDLYHV
jgi:hypothetical protein